jgi:hypothetical protein
VQKLSEEERRARRTKRHRAWSARPENKAKIAAKARLYRAKHPIPRKKRNADAQQRELQQRRGKLEVQAGRPRPSACDICGEVRERIVFDHCHQRGHFRGWLCDRCNTVLGFIEDDASLLMKIAAYLQRTRIATNLSSQFPLPGI